MVILSCLQKPEKCEENIMDGFDVSGLDTPWDDEDENNLLSTSMTTVNASESQRRKTACPSHERALPVDNTVRLLDMKEEGKFSGLFAFLGSRHCQSIVICALIFGVCLIVLV